MTVYEFFCRECGVEKEISQSPKEDLIYPVCDKCKTKMGRLFTTQMSLEDLKARNRR